MINDKMKAAFEKQFGCEAPYDLENMERAAKWTLDYLCGQQEPDIDPDEAFSMGLEKIAYYAQPTPSAPAVLDGWKLVPEKITDAMAVAAIHEALKYEPNQRPLNGTDVWAAMLAAAPSPTEKKES